MTLNDALDIVVSRTRHERYRWLCSEDNPDVAERDGYRDHVMKLATGQQPATRTIRIPATSPAPVIGCCGQIIPG